MRISAGMDLADGPHLVMRGPREAVVTFDQRFANAAQRVSTVDVRML